MCFLQVLVALAVAQSEDPAKGRTRSVEVQGGETVVLKLRVSDASHHMLTAVTFPDPVESVVSSWNEKDLSVEHERAKLFLKLFSQAEGHLDVVLTSGIHVRLFLKPAPPSEDFDGSVSIKPAPPKADEKGAPKRSAAIDLIKAMRLGQVPTGVSVRKGGDATVHARGDLETKVVYVYEASAYRGYVLRLVNASRSNGYEVDVTRFAAPRLVIAGAKSLLIPPGQSTLVYLVFWK